jgi:hypothetical protein
LKLAITAASDSADPEGQLMVAFSPARSRSPRPEPLLSGPMQVAGSYQRSYTRANIYATFLLLIAVFFEPHFCCLIHLRLYYYIFFFVSLHHLWNIKLFTCIRSYLSQR